MFLIIIILTVLAKNGIAKTSVPVFLIDGKNVIKNNNVGENPFNTLPPKEFSYAVHDLIIQIKPKITIVFLENTLCTEDITTKDRMGNPFFFLQESLKLGMVKYFPAVSDPYEVLIETFAPYRVVKVSKPEDIKGEILKQNFYVTFEDAMNETRAETLRKHDKIMREVFNTLRGTVDNSVMAFYTGKNNFVMQEEFEFRSKPNNRTREYITIPTRHALFKFYGISSNIPTRRSAFSQIPSVPAPVRTRKHLSTVMEYPDFDLQFNFSFMRDRWQLDTVALLEADEQVGLTKMYVGAPWNSSFVCGDPLIIYNLRDGSHISIPFYQIQPFDDGDDEPEPDAPEPEVAAPPPSKDQTKFGDPVNCGRYFSCNILACFFVVAVCLCILFFGVSIMMDCKANGRFDDANQKPLIITQASG